MRLHAFLVLPATLAFGTAHAADTSMSGQTMSPPAACSADVQKYCASASSDSDKQTCLNANMTKLSADCRAAMNDHSQQNGQQGQNQGQPSGY